jgi:hypothetical protein
MRTVPVLGMLVSLLVCSLLLLPAAPIAQQETGVLNPKRCNVNQLVLDTCPNLVVASFDDGRRKWSLTLAGPIALFKKLENYSREPEQIMVTEYPAFLDGQRRMLSATQAWFLYDAKGDLEVCQQPCIFAFRSKESALEAQKELGGKLLKWDEASKQAREYAAQWDPHGRRKGKL